MFLDFEDYRPDVPRVPSAMSRREGVLLAVILHLLLFIALIMFPSAFVRDEAEQVVQAVPVDPSRRVPAFVHMEPPRDVIAPPRPLAPLFDLDRRAASPVIPPRPETPDPFSQGNTPEKVLGTPAERRVGPDGPGDATLLQRVAPAPSSVTTDAGSAAAIPTPTGGGRLGDSLRNLQQYLQNQNFDNVRGGQTDQDPLIQFDSKGVEFGPWIRRFLAQVKRNWYIPEAARLLRGRVSIKFLVHRDGRVVNLEIIRESTVDQFNAAAFNALKLSNPTLPLPTEYPDETIEIIVTFLYNERQP